jgi:transcriptional regulator with XRE-family HTH domain
MYLYLPMESAMPNRDSEQPTYPVVEIVLNSIADWVSKYRDAVSASGVVGQCSPDEVKQIADDLGVSTGELRELMNKGPHAADLLQKLLVALKVDPKELARTEPLVMRDLQRLCTTCGAKKRCTQELAKGTAAAHFHEFCPNAYTLDALFEEKKQASAH